MDKISRIEQFIRECFEAYSLNYMEFFHSPCDDETLIEKAATVLGATTDTITSMDYREAMRWYDKYTYFSHREEFDYAYECSFQGKDYIPFQMADVIFGTDWAQQLPKRYNLKSIIERLVALLKDIDQSIPGTYHEEAEITNLSVSTSNFCYYDEIGEMVESYFNMFNRMKELFFRAWDNELLPDEIREYNLLVSALGIRDRVYSRHYLHYDLLRAFVETYKKEGSGDFFYYVNIHHRHVPKFWRCAQFAQNKDLVQRFVDIYPYAKQEMRKFALRVLKFECFFVWSDAEKIRFSPHEERELDDISRMLGEEPLTEEKRARWPTKV